MVSLRPLLPAALALLATGCGYLGDPLPPLANIPLRVEDVAAVQRGAQIIVQFTVPERTTENVALKHPVKLDLRIGTAGSSDGSFNAGTWAAAAKKVAQDKPPYTIPSIEWTGKTVTIAVNAIGANGKSSGWSNFVNVPVVAPPERPAGLRAEPVAEGVRLSWQGAGSDFRVLRKAGEEKEFTRLGDAPAASFTDRTAAFGTPYTYLVQQIVKLGENREAESDLSDQAAITRRDTFEPAAPAGLMAATAPDSVELSWDRNTEPDLAGYRIYRAGPGGDFEKLADVSQIPSYSDRPVEHGKTYRYAITAIDQAGNESAKSAVIEVVLP